jgi:surface polysaccharide O-acyltransferase-like enzyme
LAAEGERPRETRFVTLDALRCVAAVAIVLIHSTEAPATERLSHVARFAVPFFFAVGGYFAAGSGWGRRPWASYVARRVRRLYVPFLAWAAIYYAVRYIAHLAIPGRPPPYTSVNLLADSPTQHLWFLPGFLVTTISVFSLARGLCRVHVPPRAAALLFVVGAILISRWELPQAPLFPYTTMLTWEALPAALGGAALALVTSGRPMLPPWLGIASGTSFLGCMAWGLWVERGRTIENASGVLLLLAGLAPTSAPGVRRLAQFGWMAFGVYVAHVLFVEAAQDAMNFAKTQPSLARDLSIMVFGLVASIVTVRVLTRWRWTRWMVAVG